MKSGSIVALAGCLLIGALGSVPGFAKDETTGGRMSTAKTQDIVNTMRDRGSFHTMLDGLEQAHDLDNELKGKGPYTVFAADDKAWGKINQADKDTLFGNKDKLSQVLRYEVIKGKCLNASDLGSLGTVQTLEGKMVKVACKSGEDKKSELWINNSKVKGEEIKCSNGVLYIVDAPLMPPLVQ
ncbi:MAG TPA: fasciclin domain-containing protein [Planktothrix sp.]|jgi:uncharacterized surface protein with fasciclin (FAS1) repeats